MRPIYVFDLDGTLADISHRLKYIEQTPKDWDSFFNNCLDDLPVSPLVNLSRVLYYSGALIWIWSGRSEKVVDKTLTWLNKNNIPFQKLKMRPEGDFRKDDTLKLEWLKQLTSDEVNRIQIIFDDRNRLCEMWRAQGLTCFQVAEGNF